MSRYLGILVCLCGLAVTSGAEPRPFTAHDLVTMDRVSGAQVSPDGQQIAFTLRRTDLDANRGRTDLWLVDVKGGADPRRLTTHESSDSSPLWAPDGRSLYFLSSRSGSSQVWRLPLSGGEAAQVTDLPLGVANLVLAPDGRHLAFTIEVFTDCGDLACTVERLAEKEAKNAKGRLYEHLFVRHWDTWKDGRLSQLFSLPLDASGFVPQGAEPVRVSTGLEADVPSKPFGGASEIAFTPDGKALVFAARLSNGNEPWSTNFDLYLAPVDKASMPVKLTDNPAWDTHPVFSPDGKTLAYGAMRRPGYESDRFQIVLRSWPDWQETALAADWDRSPQDFTFSADSKTLYVIASDTGETPLFAIDVASGKVRELRRAGRVRSPRPAAGGTVVYGRDHFGSPVELYRLDPDGRETALTDFNGERLAQLAMGEAEHFSFPGWNGETVWAWLVKPADFDPAKKYPLAFLIHGGPQGSFSNNFHYRWNPQTYAGAGYAALMVDFHGSTGYGQAFTDSIRADWGGKPLQDLRKGLAAALARYPWIDAGRACALGASYGGYMINWIAGNWPDGFRCLVNHDGLFDTRSMYFTTEELWFPEWDFEGTPWENPESFARHNPARFVDRWKTPMLVIHGALDYRVVDTQGLAAFTALQRRGIPSQLLYFDTENHWVLSPHNSLQWHEVVLAWLDRWSATPGAGN